MSKWSIAAERYHAEVAAWRDVQPTTVRCLFCPEWSVSGDAGEVRDANRRHREVHHPETLKGKRVRRKVNLSNFRPAPMYDDERTEIEIERSKRAFLNGVEL